MKTVVYVMALISSCCSLDFRYVQGTGFLSSVERFSQSGVTRFSELIFDIPRYQLIVGARDHLFRLSLEGLRKLEEVQWPSDDKTITTCRQKGQSEEDCRNFIKVLISHNGKIFSCGTNAFFPQCTWREVNSLNTVTDWVGGLDKCPYSPHTNSTALITVNGDYYIASALDFSAKDGLVYRSTTKKSNLRTMQYDPKWLSGPDFIASFEIGEFVYFFFREEAVEHLKCGKTIHSRVGRVCKNDDGGKYVLKNKWTTFLKATLNCSIPGAYPFYYNELQSIHYMEQEQMIYATFTTPLNSIYGTAICGFNMSSVHRAFNGPVKYQSSLHSSWEKVTLKHNHFQCKNSQSTEHEIDSEKYQLMDEPVQSAYQKPVYTTQLERLSHIVVDVVPTKNHDGVHVIFVATAEGLIRKMLIHPKTWTTCLIEELPLFPTSNMTNILSMKLSKDVNSLYIGTETEIVKVLVQRCGRFKTEASCLNSMDPYCGWNTHQLACTTAPHRNPKITTWKQEMLDCPRVDVLTDGGWSQWSKWTECSQTGLDTTGDRCLCHDRTCTNPSPSNGGKPCSGIAQEVTNCTRNGQWTEWSAWSSCSASCGVAVKTRRRICGNPSPAFGGRVCIGPERDEIYCPQNPPCKDNSLEPIDGQWSEWSTWDECSAICGGGIQSKRRKCNSPAPTNGGRDCGGCHQDYRQCNTHKCPEVRKSTPWTPWLKANSSRDGHFEQRFRFTCRVNVPDASMSRVGPVKKEERFCLEGSQSCLDAAFVNIDGEWSDWAAWSKCTVPCGGGTQSRERLCDNPRPSGNGGDCQGEARQEQECNMHSCEALDGWKEWSVWSLCDNSKEQHRRRTCIYDSPAPTHCRGPTKETRLCIDNQIYSAAESKSPVDDGIHVAHVISACICGTIFGSVVTFVVLYVWFKRKCRTNLSGLNQLRLSKPNHYEPDGNEWKNQYNNALNDTSKIPLREATIKRSGGIRAQLSSDQNF